MLRERGQHNGIDRRREMLRKWGNRWAAVATGSGQLERKAGEGMVSTARGTLLLPASCQPATLTVRRRGKSRGRGREGRHPPQASLGGELGIGGMLISRWAEASADCARPWAMLSTKMALNRPDAQRLGTINVWVAEWWESGGLGQHNILLGRK